MKIRNICYFFGILLVLPNFCPGAKILSAVFVSTKSHKIVYDPLLEALAERGHEVTVLSSFPVNKNITNLREIISIDTEDMMEKFPNLFEMKVKKESMSPFWMTEIFAKICRESAALPQVKELLNEKFDLVISQPFVNECALGYLSQFKAPMILITTVATAGKLAGLLGTPSPVSFVPNQFTGYQEKMRFTERVLNFIIEFSLAALQKFYFVPKMEAVYRDALGDPNLPDFEAIVENVSLILSNSHFSLSGRRPFLPDIIEVGGMHCRPAKPLPKDLEEFVESSGKDGFIFFSMGSALTGSKMPDKYRKILLSAFAKLKQKVLWKWETTMTDLPPNVKLIKWAPQQDILGHPKIRVFITHGGLGSTTEAVYHGVPLIGIPMFGDQILNMQQSVAGGYAYVLEFLELSEEKVLTAINTVLGNPTYKENVQALSNIFRDQPMKPLDRAVYWTEYVLRHKGATHLRSAGRNLNFFQYHSLDVVGFLLASLALTIYSLLAMLRFITKRICGFLKSKIVVRQKNKKKNN